MTEQQDREPRLLAFICNWAYYTPYEQAEVRRAASDGIRIVRVPCSGRVSPQLLLSALQEGYDAVVLVGCAPEACHYREGSRLAQQRLETLRRFLAYLGLEPERIHLFWKSPLTGPPLADMLGEARTAARKAGAASRLMRVSEP